MATFDFHHSMLTDEVRTSSFLRAIMEVVEPGDVVVDIGSGTGVLSLFAAMAGASRVYAIEREPVIEIASEIAARNGLSETIAFIAGSSLEVDIPEQADVLITETIGNAGFDEGIVAWVADARRRFLKHDALVVPGRVDAVASLICVPTDFMAIDKWSRPLQTLDFTPLSRIVRNNLIWTDLSPAAIVSEPVVVFGTDFSSEPKWLTGSVRVEAIKDALVHGIGMWFRSSLAPNTQITNAPPNTVPSWEQGFLPLDEPMVVAAGDQIRFEVSSAASGAEWRWQVGSGRTHITSDGQLSMRKVEEAVK
ncbi:MAG: 50S ribosomal protein L11 methyltransferase [Actinomycetia bacterium]|nr:50S ribosomal protein L11 methyltransferase [Actinomycetes bacterium]